MTSKKKTPSKKKAALASEAVDAVGVGDVAPPEAPVTALVAPSTPRRSPFMAYQAQVLGSALAQIAPGASFEEKALRKHWRGGTEPREVAQSVLAGLGPMLPALPPAPHDLAALGCPPDVRDANPVAPSSYDTAYARWHSDASHLAGGAVDHVRGRAAWKKGMGPEDFARLENPRAQIRPLRDDEGEFRHEQPRGHEPARHSTRAAPGFIHEKRDHEGQFREPNPRAQIRPLRDEAGEFRHEQPRGHEPARHSSRAAPGFIHEKRDAEGEFREPNPLGSPDPYRAGYRHAQTMHRKEVERGERIPRMTTQHTEAALEELLGRRPSERQFEEYVEGHADGLRALRGRRHNPVEGTPREDNPVRRGDDGRYESSEEQEEERRERARRRHNPIDTEGGSVGRHERPITLAEWLRDHPERSEMRPTGMTQDGVPVYRFR